MLKWEPKPVFIQALFQISFHYKITDNEFAQKFIKTHSE